VRKESYYHPDNIAEAAQALSQGLLDEPARRRVQFSPARAALLILDMQEYFLQPASHAFIPSAPAILPGLCALTEAFSAAARPLIFTRHCNTPQDAGMMRRWWRELLTPDHPLSAITSHFDLTQGRLLTKSQYDAFYHTDLESVLRQAGVEQLVIGGVMTHLCCETTARSAFTRGFAVFFLTDGTATYHADFQRAALLNLAHGFAVLTSVADLLAEMRAEEQHVA